MDKFYQVFISSTYTDLVEERKAVSDELAKAGHIAAGMELFPAIDEDQFDYIKRIIDRSDYYLVIVAGRYGSCASDGVGYTEKEFDYAKSRGIPIIALIHNAPGKIAVANTDTDPDILIKLAAFRTKCQTGRVTRYWSNSHELCMAALTSVSHQINLRPGIGWIRGDQAIDPRVLQEAERLRIENEELKNRIAETTSNEIIFDPDLIGPDEVQSWTIRNNATGETHGVVSDTGDIFIEIYDRLLASTLLGNLSVSIAEFLRARAGLNGSFQFQDFIRLRDQLEGLGLIIPEGIDYAGKRRNVWSLTPLGRRFASKRRVLSNMFG